MADELIAVVLVAFCSFCDLFACKRGSDVQVNVALLLHYTDQDAVQVFAFLLDVLMLTGNHQFTCLQDVARLDFI